MSKLESDFLEAWHAYPGLQEPEREHRFHPTRRWRFDFAFPAFKVAVEMEGGGGRHHSFAGHHGDCDKYNAATNLGWRILRFTAKHVKQEPDEMVQLILTAIGSSPKASLELTPGTPPGKE